jgi:hypothetical protein
MYKKNLEYKIVNLRKLVRFFVVENVHRSSSSRLRTRRMMCLGHDYAVVNPAWALPWRHALRRSPPPPPKKNQP